jgi:hypothetical protein
MNGGGGGGNGEEEEENTETAESDLIATLERRRDQAQRQQGSSSPSMRKISSAYSSFDQYPGAAVPGECLPFGDHLPGDSFGRIYDMVHNTTTSTTTSKEQGTVVGNSPRSNKSAGGGRVRTRSETLAPSDSNTTSPANPRRHPGSSHARSISSSSILPSSSATAVVAAPRHDGRPTLQKYHRSLSKREISSTRAVLQRALHTQHTGHYRLATLLQEMKEQHPVDSLLQSTMVEGGSSAKSNFTRNHPPGNANGIHSNTTTTLNWDKTKKPGSTTDTDLITNAVRIDKLFRPSSSSASSSSSPPHDNRMASAATTLLDGNSYPHIPSTESIPLLDPTYSRRGNITSSSSGGSGSGSGLCISERQRKKWKKSMQQVCWWLHPWHVIQLLLQTMQHSWAVLVGLPAAIVAWVLYYYIDNPELDFLPGQASLSWWINFSSRQICTLDLARLTQYLYIDQLSLKSSFTVTVFGPYFTLLSIQARGWPFVLTMWGVWNLVLLHGDNPFQTHWLYQTGFEIYTVANSGSYILHSETYLRCLLAMIVAGVAMGVKRTMVAMYFGRRTIANYKPKMEALLDDIILVAQIAELAEEANKAAAAAAAAASTTVTAKGGGAGLVRPEAKIDLESVKSKFRGVQFHDMTKSKATVFDGSNDDNDNKDDTTEVAAVTSAQEEEDVQRETLKAEVDNRSMDEIIEDAFAGTESDDDDEDPFMAPGYQRSASEMDQIKNSLDRWQEPINKLDKVRFCVILNRNVVQQMRAHETLTVTIFLELYGNTVHNSQTMHPWEIY